MLSGLDTAWISSTTSNGLQSHGHPHWRMVQLETSKLLELGCVLPATVLPHFQMYRWAFVGGKYVDSNNTDGEMNGHIEADITHKTSSVFVPHVNRIARLMEIRYHNNSPQQPIRSHKSSTNNITTPPIASHHHLVLTCQTITNIQDLYPFFSTLGNSWAKHSGDNEKDLANCLAEIEQLLAADFLEKMPSNVSAR